jgi:hypothetical protein
MYTPAVTKSCRRRLSILVAMACLVPAGGIAQERQWEAELYGGGVAARTGSDGTRTLPPAGAALVTSNPIFPSREVPSWFFGDGAALLNGVAGEFGSGAIAPLDALFGRVSGGRSAAGGARIRRRLSPRVAVELSADILGRARLASPDFAAAVDAVRASFDNAFTGLLASGPFSSVTVEATAAIAADRRRDVAATGAFSADLRSLGALTPYVTFGGGVVFGAGALPSAELTGRYRFAILGVVPVDESDRVTIRFEHPAAFAAVAGGGLRRDLSEKWGLRFDVRALIGPDVRRVTVTASPSTIPGVPAGFVESFTSPAIQFSNDPSTGRRSSLSAPALQDVRVFSGGFRALTMVTLGISRRF